MANSVTQQQLKQQAYRLAGVKTTSALKKKHSALSTLDMRRKASWVRAIELLENIAQGIPVWDGAADSIDGTLHKLLDFQDQLVEEICEISLNQIAANKEFIL
ncbi:hypothetical protein C1752_02064 [Acaryochloris thomasi RCC1774]|uniref:Uncharacterized protein n=1 Tax=Acaryochloris thomasi RCC1774 TaxID=1764569 RepID=A0A2W1JJT2_9CYAN|nr:hypothetical protein [Acaryochloris thomasi]PZD73659.1 hypothetical protein C1752_02064 [Acaryochloris thomasi RCC1774]